MLGIYVIQLMWPASGTSNFKQGWKTYLNESGSPTTAYKKTERPPAYPDIFMCLYKNLVEDLDTFVNITACPLLRTQNATLEGNIDHA